MTGIDLLQYGTTGAASPMRTRCFAISIAGNKTTSASGRLNRGRTRYDHCQRNPRDS
jgi:hypothetical protein